MKLIKSIIAIFILVLPTSFAFAEVESNIQIIGHIGNAFDKTKVKVKDSHGQTYYLPKSVFPKDFKFKNGTAFNVEISEELFQTLPKPKH